MKQTEHIISCRVPTKEDSYDSIKQTISYFFYQAGLLFERMENEGLISGNGHHIAQDISSYAVNLYKERRFS